MLSDIREPKYGYKQQILYFMYFKQHNAKPKENAFLPHLTYLMHIFILEKKYIGIHVMFPKLLHVFKPRTISYYKDIVIGMRKINTFVIKSFSNREKKKGQNKLTGVLHSPRRTASCSDSLPCTASNLIKKKLFYQFAIFKRTNSPSR